MQKTSRGIEGYLQDSQDNELVEHFFYSPKILHVQIGPHQQCQGTCGSFFYFEVFVKYKDVIMIFPESFVTLTPTLKSHLEDQADERVDYGVCDDMFDARDVQNKGERTPR